MIQEGTDSNSKGCTDQRNHLRSLRKLTKNKGTNLYKNVSSSIIYNRKKTDQPKCPLTDGWINCGLCT